MSRARRGSRAAHSGAAPTAATTVALPGDTPDPDGAQPPALDVRGAGKAYAGVPALRGVDLSVQRGHIHALLGGNGSGKSTLITLLAGVSPGDVTGSLRLGAGDTHPLSGWDAEQAYAAGLRFVHQHAAVFGELTVAENLAFGARWPTGRLGRIRWRELHRRSADLLERYHVPARPDTPLRELREADRMRVSIIRALGDREDATAGVLVLDEPTAALPPAEAADLLASLRRYAAAGQTIVYVTHRLDEVLDVADRVTVLRDGATVATLPRGALSKAVLVEHIAGQAVEAPPAATAVAGGAPVLAARGLTGGPLRGVDLDLHAGEVVGLAGLLGSGRTEVLRALFGAEPSVTGTVLRRGAAVRYRHPADALADGVVYIPEDRQREGVFAGESVRRNVSHGDAAAFRRGGLLRRRLEAAEVRAALAATTVRAPSDRHPVEALSGGNQQKVVLARVLRRRPQVLLLDEPTQGVDVAARAEIHHLIRAAAAAGASALVVASDPDELAVLCDRVLVLAGGRIVRAATQPLTVADVTALLTVEERAA